MVNASQEHLLSKFIVLKLSTKHYGIFFHLRLVNKCMRKLRFRLNNTMIFIASN